MENRKKIFTLITLLFASTSIWTTTSGFRSLSYVEPPAQGEIAGYFKENILPVIRQQREKLDEMLSSKEKEEIEMLRKRIREQRESRRDGWAQQNRGDQKPPIWDEEMVEARKTRINQHREIMKGLSRITEKHETEIGALLEEIQQNIPAWSEEIHKIRIDSGFTRSPGRRGMHGRGPEAGMGPGHAGWGPGNSFRSHMPGFGFAFHPEMFLLLDPDNMEGMLNGRPRNRGGN